MDDFTPRGIPMAATGAAPRRGSPALARRIRPVPRPSDTYEAAREFAHADLPDLSDGDLRDDRDRTRLAIAVGGDRAHWWLHERRERIARELARRGCRP